MSGYESDKPVSDEDLGLVPPSAAKVEPAKVEDEVKDEQKEPVKAVDPKDVKDPEDKEESDEDDSDAEADEDKQEDKKPSKRDNRVPLSRFKQKDEEAKAAKEELARERQRHDEDRARWIQELELKAPKEPPKPAIPEYDFDAKEDEYVSLMKDMEYDEAKKLRKEINKALAEKSSKDAERLADERFEKYSKEQEKKQAEAEQARAEREAKRLVADMESRHDIFNQKSENFNRKAALLFNAELNDLVAQGMSLADAFKVAEEEVVPLFSKVVKKSGLEERNKNADRIAEEDSKKIPPMTSKAGVGTKSEDTPLFKSKNFTQKDWDNASEDDRQRALGLK